MFELFLRDGVLYFLAVVPVAVVSSAICHLVRPTLGNVSVGFQCALNSIIASRVLLNIRGTATEESRQSAQEENINMTVLSVMQYSDVTP